MDKRRLPRTLEESIGSHKCVPFVGSGLSIPLGIPDWRTALKRLVHSCREEQCPDLDEVEALLYDGKYLDVAQKCRELMGNPIYGKEMRKMFGDYDREQSRRNHELIWNLSPPLVLTTNFDTILEDSTKPRPPVVTHKNRAEVGSLLTGKHLKTLFKIHGTISDIESIVFTREDYKRLYQEHSAYTIALETVILKHHLLFIGFGLVDEGVTGILEAVKRLFGGWAGGPHYALVKREKTRDKELWEEYGIKTILYNDHSDVEGILAHCVDLLRTKPKPKKVAPRPGTPSRARIPTPNALSGLKGLEAMADRCIDECIIAALCPFDKATGHLAGWKKEDIFLELELKYFRPTGILERMTENVSRYFRKKGRYNSPRLSLSEFRIEPMDSFSRGALSLRSRITDWSLVHGIQDILRDDQEQKYFWKDLNDAFWKSVSSAISQGICASFPHHLAIHCLTISSDERVILNKRHVAFNQRGRISASFEEQMQFPYIFPADDRHPERLFDGDESPFATARRGIREEFNLEVNENDFTFLALAFEASSVAANLLCVVKTMETAQEIYSKWKTADDKAENLMIEPDLLPMWDIVHLKDFMASEKVYEDNTLYQGRWHASSIARILLGLLWDFGVEEVQKHVDISSLLAI